jgi:predicted transcriptional regulator
MLRPPRLSAQALRRRSQALILEAIAKAPGLSLRETIESSGLASATVLTHLKWLRSTGQIVMVKRGAKHCHYPAGTKPEKPALDAHLQPVLKWLKGHPGAYQGAVIDAFPKVPRSTIQHRLNVLVKQGMLRRKREGHYVSFWPK